MLEVKLHRTPSMRLLLYDLRRSTDNLRDAMILIRNDMFVASLHKNCRIPHWHENPLQHVPGASTPDDCNKPRGLTQKVSCFVPITLTATPFSPAYFTAIPSRVYS